jgi:hypothetical protein
LPSTRAQSLNQAVSLLDLTQLSELVSTSKRKRFEKRARIIMLNALLSSSILAEVELDFQSQEPLLPAQTDDSEKRWQQTVAGQDNSGTASTFSGKKNQGGVHVQVTVAGLHGESPKPSQGPKWHQLALIGEPTPLHRLSGDLITSTSATEVPVKPGNTFNLATGTEQEDFLGFSSKMQNLLRQMYKSNKDAKSEE